MLRASLRKIKSAPKTALLLLACGIILVGAGSAVLIYAAQHHQSAPQYALQMRAGSTHYTLEVAATETAQEQGLGGRVAMDDNKGMIFTYGGDGQRCFWMKDMHFSLDMIWVNDLHQITHVEPNVSPATYPRTYCYVGEYVIELNGGQAAKNHLKPGQTLGF